VANKDRYQNPVIGDTVALRTFVYNSNNTAALDSIVEVKIYYLDPDMRSESNPDGRTLIQTIPSGSVTNPALGEYQLDLYLDPLLYVNTGRYIDEWVVIFQSGDPQTSLEHLFQVYPDLWYTTPIPVVYDFDFYFQPNKFKTGTKKYIEIEIVPNVPRATDLEAYYENLAIAATVYVSISRRCGECVPCEEDLRLVVDRAPTQYKEKNRAYYYFDSTLFDCGVYDIWFELDFGGNVYISDTNQIQIYS
jgi:hypothetical protein